MARTDTACTDFYRRYAAVSDGLDFLKIGIPDSTRLVVGVTDIISEAWAFSTDFTFS